MKFKILSHACLSITEDDFNLTIDPWIIGSCYWRSWWNYPEVEQKHLNSLKADALYLTHLHWDHFHGPSLKKYFQKDIKIYVPKVLTRRMVEDLNYLGFENIIEVHHAVPKKINKNMEICSYQFGPGVDSGLIISTKEHNLLNINDCKTFGHSLKQIKNRYRNIDFTFRSHSSASAIPYCIESYEKDFSNFRTQKDYMEEFSAFCQKVGTKYAIPFASNHCFLHKDTIKYNELAVNPKMIVPVFNEMKNKNNSDSQIVVMPPGSSWNSQNNDFQIIDFDYNTQKYVTKLNNKYKKKLKIQYKIEKSVIANYGNFKSYFEKFNNSIPLFIKHKFKKPFIFHINDYEGEKFWEINIIKNTIKQRNDNVNESIQIKIPALVLNDCTQIKMFSVWTASKRLSIKLPEKSDIKQIESFFMCLDMYELERFPLFNNLRFRSLINIARRWREMLTGLIFIIKYKVFNKELVIKNLYQ